MEIEISLNDDELSLLIERLDTGEELLPFEYELLRKLDNQRSILRTMILEDERT